VSTDGRAVLDFLDRKTVVQMVLGFAVAMVVLYLVAVGVGVDAIRQALAGARLRWLAAGAASTALGLVFWGKAWQVVLRVVGVEVPYRRLVVTYFAATFANYVTPLGQAGGEPFIAYVLSRDTEASYEDSLASVVTADLLNLLPFFTFAAIGFVALVARTTLPDEIEPLAGGLLALGVGVPLGLLVGWRFRKPVGRILLRAVAPLARRIEHRAITVARLRNRLHELNEAFERIAQDRTALVEALSFSFVGWVFFALPLYFAGLTIGVHIGLLAVLFIVPASTIAGLTPSPGGLGGVELALVALLVAVAGLAAADGYAIAVIYRLASYWFALALGGIATLSVIARN
jgi:uncharacterized protein (TIRG00374 family)